MMTERVEIVGGYTRNDDKLESLRHPIMKNDCVIRAILVATNDRFGYQYVRNWLKSNGYRLRTRHKNESAIAFFKAHNIRFLHYFRPRGKSIKGARSKPDDRFDGETVKAFAEQGYAGNFVLQVSGHMLGVRDGKVIDWAAGRKHRIQGITQVFMDEK